MILKTAANYNDEGGYIEAWKNSDGTTEVKLIPKSGGGGDDDEEKNGLLSLTISPAVTTTPTLDALLPLDYDELVAQGYQPDEYGAITVTVEVILPSDGDQYTITATPTSGWYAQNNETNVIGEQGQAVTYNTEIEDNANLAVVYESIPEQPPVKTIIVMAHIDK